MTDVKANVSAVDAVLDSVDTQLQAVIDGVNVDDLQAQVEALEAQIAPLQEQLATIRQIIHDREGPEIVKARNMQMRLRRLKIGGRLPGR